MLKNKQRPDLKIDEEKELLEIVDDLGGKTIKREDSFLVTMPNGGYVDITAGEDTKFELNAYKNMREKIEVSVDDISLGNKMNNLDEVSFYLETASMVNLDEAVVKTEKIGQGGAKNNTTKGESTNIEPPKLRLAKN